MACEKPIAVFIYLMHCGYWVSDHTPRVPQTCCLITVSWLAHGYESPSCLTRIDLLLLTASKSEISHHVFGVFLCVFSHTLQHHLSPRHSPRGFQVLASFALIRVTSDQADRLIFPTLHGAVRQQCLGPTRHQSGFIISYLLCVANVQRASGSLRVHKVGRQSTRTSNRQ